MRDHYQTTIQKTLDYIRSNLSEQLTLPGIAKAMGYSRSRLSEIFKNGTGKGIMSQLIDLRIGKAKELLCRTNMSVSEISSSVGFNSHTSFDIAFFKAMQVSPTEFRRRAKSSDAGTEMAGFGTAESRLWFSDSMAKGLRKETWQPFDGEWLGEQGCVLGRNEGAFRLRFGKLLPENFHLQFEIQLESAYGCPASTAAISLQDQTHGSECYGFVLGGDFNTMGTLSRKGVVSSLNRDARIVEGRWHRIDLVLNDDSLSLRQDGVAMFQYRDPFPVPYANRCKLVLWGWRSMIRIRNMEIEDLGFLPMALSVRQGDMLFNSGLYEQARQLYARMGETGSAPADVSELHYKIGMCHLRNGDFEKARLWAGKAALFPAGVFWSQQASLTLMEADWQENRVADFLSKLVSLFPKAPMRDPLREKIRDATQDLLRRGFGDTALVLATRLLELEETGTYCYRQALAAVIDILHTQNRFEKAMLCQQELLALLRDRPHNRIFPLFTVVDTCNCLGQANEARRALAEIRGITRNFSDLARTDVYGALCFRVEARYAVAHEILSGITRKYPGAGVIRKFAELVLSTLLVSMGRIDEAKEALERAAQLFPEWSYPQKGARGEYGYPPWCAEGNYGKAAELLLEDSRHDDSAPALRAGQALRAGILFELACDKNGARGIWEEVIRKYPSPRCAYYADLAQFFLGKGMDCLEAMPFPVRARSEMFYLAGLLMESRGDQDRSRSLLRHSADEDLMNHWPAVLARKKLLASAGH